jgi:hypothetical protein
MPLCHPIQSLEKLLAKPNWRGLHHPQLAIGLACTHGFPRLSLILHAFGDWLTSDIRIIEASTGLFEGESRAAELDSLSKPGARLGQKEQHI